MARFTEIFSNKTTKYQRVATWLVARHGVVATSLRDTFTAGGKVDIELEGAIYHKLPHIYGHLKDSLPEIIQILKTMPPEDANAYLKPGTLSPLSVWSEDILRYAGEYSPKTKKFVKQLLKEAP